jgi:hypothetical protein
MQSNGLLPRTIDMFVPHLNACLLFNSKLLYCCISLRLALSRRSKYCVIEYCGLDCNQEEDEFVFW